MGVADSLALLAVEDIGLGHGLIAAAAEHGLDAVLNILDGDLAVMDLAEEIRRDLERQKIDDAVVIIGVGGLEGLFHGGRDLGDIKLHDLSVALYYLVHVFLLFVFVVLCS